MSDAYGVLDRMVDALARGDREAALECFAPGATVVVSGSHHDYASYAPTTAVDGLLRSFMEISWTPSLRRMVGGARVEEGVLAATHIGPFLGSDPTGERVVANLRISSSLAPDGRLETLSVWGSREAVLGSSVSSWAPPASPTPSSHSPRAALHRFATTPRGDRGLPGAATAPARDTADPVSAPPRRPIVPALVVRNRPRRQIALWGISALALLGLLVGVIQVTLRFLPGADAVAERSRSPSVTPTPKPTVIATIPPIIKESTQQVPSSARGRTRSTSRSSPAAPTPGSPWSARTCSSTSTPQSSRRRPSATSRTSPARSSAGTSAAHLHPRLHRRPRLQGARAGAVRAAGRGRSSQDQLRGYPVRLVTAGYGEEDPIADNSNPVQQALNRRVMVLYRPPGAP